MPSLYDIIRSARAGDESPQSPSADPDELRRVLEALGDDDVTAFGTAFDAELVRLNVWSVWDAGYVAVGGMSNDGFHYFRSWLIGKGQAVVEQALANADALAPFLDDRDLDNELLEYVALDILEERGIAVDPRGSTDETPDDESMGHKVEDAESLDDLFPQLAAWRRTV